MEAWIKVYHDLSEHRKIYDLARGLHIKQYAAVGLVVSLWSWALIHATDGRLEKYPEEAIARACFWEKDAKNLVTNLLSAGFLDEDLRIHDWDSYAGAIIEADEKRKEKTKKRVAEHRAKKAGKQAETTVSEESEPDEEAPCNTPGNAPVTRYTSVTQPLRNADVRECNAHRREENRIDNNSNHHDDDYYSGSSVTESVTPSVTDDPESDPLTITDSEADAYRERLALLEDTCRECGIAFTSGTVMELEKLIDEYSEEWVVKAIRASLEGKEQTLRYIRGILRNWKDAGGIDQGKQKRQAQEPIQHSDEVLSEWGGSL